MIEYNTVPVIESALRFLGFKFTVEHEHTFCFEYNDDQFKISCYDDYVSIGDYRWTAVYKDDVDLTEFEDAISENNFMYRATLIHTPPNAYGQYVLSTTMTINILLDHPQNAILIKTLMDHILEANEGFCDMLDKIIKPHEL